MMNFDKVEKYRSNKNPTLPPTKKGDKFGFFIVPIISKKLKDRLKHLNVVVAPEDSEWQHISVSLVNRCPTWNEMCLVKDLFFDENDVVVQFHPKKSEYINNHPYCLHLWKWTKGEFPTPPKILVGI